MADSIIVVYVVRTGRGIVSGRINVAAVIVCVLQRFVGRRWQRQYDHIAAVRSRVIRSVVTEQMRNLLVLG